MATTEPKLSSKPQCPRCGSTNTFFTGWRYRRGYKVHIAVCKSCGSIFPVEKEPLGGKVNG